MWSVKAIWTPCRISYWFIALMTSCWLCRMSKRRLVCCKLAKTQEFRGQEWSRRFRISHFSKVIFMPVVWDVNMENGKVNINLKKLYIYVNLLVLLNTFYKNFLVFFFELDFWTYERVTSILLVSQCERRGIIITYDILCNMKMPSGWDSWIIVRVK